MQTLNQRWLLKRSSFRPEEPIDHRLYDVAPIGETEAKAFVITHHYSASYPAARFRYGLYRAGHLQGVAVFSHPCNDAVLTNVFGGSPRESVELGRFVLLDEVPGNGETWFLGQCFRQLRQERISGVVSFSDPMPRKTPSGEVLFCGHFGGIYQAHNGAYLGRSCARSLRMFQDGTVLHARTISKIRAKDVGWEYSVGMLVDRGAAEPWGTTAQELSEWLTVQLKALTRLQRHKGNHRYAWRLKGARMRSTEPYPKMLDVAA